MDSIGATLRPNWFVDVCAAQQRLAGSTLDGDCDTFARGLDRFWDDLPAPGSQIERRVLHDCIVATLTEAGHQCHTAFHERHPYIPCGGSPLSELAALVRSADSQPGIMRWSQEYLRAFKEQHVWPAHWRAARYLDRHFREALDVAGLAHHVASGRATLTSQFKQAFGVTIRRYHRRLRIREALVELRRVGSKVEDVARMVGYQSAKNFYQGLKDETGLTPSAVRELSESELRRLLDVTLSSPHSRILAGEAVRASVGAPDFDQRPGVVQSGQKEQDACARPLLQVLSAPSGT